MRLLHVLSPKIDEYREECVRATENEGIFEVSSFYPSNAMIDGYFSIWTSFMFYFSDTNQHGRTSKVFELQAEVPLAEENSCFWIHCGTSGDKIIHELLSSSLHPYGPRAKHGLEWII